MESNRQILVIGSQCAAIPPPLSFLPGLAEELFRLMTDPQVGACSEGSSRLLIDPTADEARTVIKEAFADASRNEATLVLAFIGHGQSIGDDFYLQLRDSPAEQVDDENAIHLVNLVKGQHRIHSNLDGLVALIDSCYSGAGATDAAANWVRELSGTLRFAMMTASGNRSAYEGCFTRTLVDCLTQGMDSVAGGFLRCEHVRGVIRQKCPFQEPQFPSYNLEFDDGLYLAKNRASLRRAGGSLIELSRVQEEIERLTANFQPTPVLSQIVERSRQAARGLALIGVAGVGKSTLAAALARPEVTGGAVPDGFVQAVAFFPAGLIAGDLARTLAMQLDRNLPGFAAARERFLEANEDRLVELDTLQIDVLGPLSRLTGAGVVRIVIDGLDQVPADSAEGIRSALTALAAMSHIRLIVTARPDTSQPTALTRLPIDIVEDEYLLSYLKGRRVPEALCQAITGRARGNWLVAKLLADRALASADLDATRLPARLSEIYAQSLRGAGANTTERWRGEFRPILGVLAAAGVGPVVPLKLLCAAGGRLGGPDRPFRVRDRLVDLRGLIARDRPGTDDEHVGLFHQTFVDYLLDPDNDTFGVDPQGPHRALAEAIDELAPAEFHNPNDPIYRYALTKEADHLWAIGEFGRWVNIPDQRDSEIPAENLRRWLSWSPRIQRALGPDHSISLGARAKIAHWTGAAGDARGALRLYRELLLEVTRVLGPDHPNTLSTRHNIAFSTGELGDGREALRLSRELLPEETRVLGPDHPDTLTTRGNIAAWTAEVGDVREGLRLLQELLPEETRVLGPDHPDTLRTRGNIAHWTGQVGDVREGLRLFQELLPDQTRVLGPDHPNTLATRNNIATWTGEVGDAREGLRLLQELLPDRARVLGPDHPDTLTTRVNIATWTGKVGDAREGLRLSREVLPDQTRVLGPDHPNTLLTRQNIAAWTGELGDGREALRLLRELLPDQTRVLGPDHPDTQRTVKAIKWLEQQSQDRSDDQGTVGVIEASEQHSQDRTETPGSVSKISWLERVKRFFRR
jgi:phage tail protein X